MRGVEDLVGLDAGCRANRTKMCALRPMFHRRREDLCCDRFGWLYFSPLFPQQSLATDEFETTEVKGVIQQFHQALDRHEVATIEALVSAEIVVL